MTLIWEGPRTRDGKFLWYGLRPGTESWGANPAFPKVGICVTVEVDGKWKPKPFGMSEEYIGAWLIKKSDWDWKSLTFAQFEELFEQSISELSSTASDDPDLTAFFRLGGKLVISHGANDQIVPASGSVDYYNALTKVIGSEDETRSFARLFISEGDVHGTSVKGGPGLTSANAMTALMNWVEKGEAPEEIRGSFTDSATGKVSTRPVYAYPMVPAYSGNGSADEASSFVPVHLATRLRL